jgi:hypothetical protein
LINPDYVRGFIDANGGFYLPRASTGKTVSPEFVVVNSDRTVLAMIQSLLGGVGKILVKKRKSSWGRPTYALRVRRHDELMRVVEFFREHPLIVKRRAFQRLKRFLEGRRFRARVRHPEEVVRRAVEMYVEGYPVKQIEQETGVKSVSRLAKRFGVPARNRRWDTQQLYDMYWKQGLSPAEMAVRFGVPTRYMCAILRRKGILRKGRAPSEV